MITECEKTRGCCCGPQRLKQCGRAKVWLVDKFPQIIDSGTGGLNPRTSRTTIGSGVHGRAPKTLTRSKFKDQLPADPDGTGLISYNKLRHLNPG
jgi:hypothetical protein